jgi:hypothetical protein
MFPDIWEPVQGIATPMFEAFFIDPEARYTFPTSSSIFRSHEDLFKRSPSLIIAKYLHKPAF